ncbi:MAG TPA: ATP-binding protein [Dehalococcoidia bacterium]|nr:ATP-binding protein [Dehalococcoidia bacterium]
MCYAADVTHRQDFRIQQLRLLPDDGIVQFLTSRPEDQWLDRVSARTTARHLADVMIGFANAEGGLIVVGIHDGKVEGIKGAGLRAQNEWRQAAVDFSQPPVRHAFELIDCENANGQTDQIAVVEIESAERVHTNVRGETYLRVGDENRQLGLREAQELHFDKGDSSFDALPVDGSLADLDSTMVKRYVDAVRARGRPEVALIARGLAVERKGKLVPTAAGLLLLGSEPQLRFPEAFVRVLRYQGSSRETGVRANVVSDRRVEGALPQQIDTVRRLIARRLPRAMRLGSGGRFSRSTTIPEFAWLEAVVNAVTHRAYSIGGDHIRVEIFDDRVEVESPGRLPGLVRLDNLRSTRFARNPRIARALSDLGYGRELGEGINRMFEEMNLNGLPDPVYQQSAASVKVILLADTIVARMLEFLPPGSERFAEHLSRVGRVSTKEAIVLLGSSRPTVLRYLHDLTQRGFLEHTGTSLKDPRGSWRVITQQTDR